MPMEIAPSTICRIFWPRIGLCPESGTAETRGMRVCHDRIRRMLLNPFYYGHFEYGGEVYEGKHPPIISKALFDKVQEVLETRTRHIAPERVPKIFTSLMRCGECGRMVTAEVQKSHTYHRCTKKSKAAKCSQPFLREEELDRQLSALLSQFTLRPRLGRGDARHARKRREGHHGRITRLHRGEIGRTRPNRSKTPTAA